MLKGLITLAITAGAAGAVYLAVQYKPPVKQAQNRRPGTDFPVPVVVGVAKRTDIPVYFDGVGTAKALNTVTVKPQVDGKIMSLSFKEGQDVKKGQLLAKIDPTTYQAQVDQAAARKALSEVQLANAKRDLARYSQLSANVVAQKTQDTQRAAVDQLEAQIKADAAAIANLKAFVDWTNVTAPIDGRTGIRLVDEGNLVRASDAGLVTISQLQPISVLFTLPQQQLAQVNRSMAQGALTVETIDSDNKTALDKGVVRVVDNQVDQTTGTVRLKAELPNEKMQLWPGQFINIRLLVDTLKDVVVVPSQALQRGPAGPFVYVAGTDDVVKVRPVTLGLQTELQTVVTKGIEPEERVVTTGFGRLKDGAKIQAAPQGEQPPAGSAPSATPPATGGATSQAPSSSGGQGGGKGEGRRRREGSDAASGTASGAAAAAQGGGASDVRTACRVDAETLCPGAEREARRACMESNKDKLSEGCKSALRAAFGASAGGTPAGGNTAKAQP
jgi:membrane fusion protein, multidrug efflux system